MTDEAWREVKRDFMSAMDQDTALIEERASHGEKDECAGSDWPRPYPAIEFWLRASHDAPVVGLTATEEREVIDALTSG